MPFSRRRRHHRRRKVASLAFTIGADMTIPDRATAYPITPVSPNLLTDETTGFFPVSGTTSDNGAYVSNVMAEVVQSGFIGVYSFDFTRLLAQSFGVVTTGTPFVTFPGFFRRIKFGRGYMKITRCDTGSNTMVVSHNDGSDPPLVDLAGAYNSGNISLPVKLHYIRLRPTESTWTVTLLNQRAFMADRRRRTVTLMPNRSVTFSFSARRHIAPSYVAHTIRDMAGTLGGEVDQFRRCEIPGRTRNLGWVPTPLTAYTNYTNDGTTHNPGLGSGLWRIVSPAIAFLVEVVNHSAITLQPSTGTPTVPVPAIPSLTTFAPLFTPFIRRSERCRVRVADLIQPVFGVDGGTNTAVARVGKVYTAFGHNIAQTGSPNIVDPFDPPRVTSLTTTEGQQPLFRDSEAYTLWSTRAVPLDIQPALMPAGQSAFPVPPAGGMP